MTPTRRHRGVVFVGGSLLLFWLACGSGNGDSSPKWNCLPQSDECTCTQLRPGKLRQPGIEYADRCPSAQCCLLNSEGDESYVAVCTCISVADDCAMKATQSQTKVVPTCPPP